MWHQSAGEVQKLLGACNENIRTLVAVLVGTGMRLDEALHLTPLECPRRFWQTRELTESS